MTKCCLNFNCRTKSLRTSWWQPDFRENHKVRGALLRSHTECGVTRVVLSPKMSRLPKHLLSLGRVFSWAQEMHHFGRGHGFPRWSTRSAASRGERLLRTCLCSWYVYGKLLKKCSWNQTKSICFSWPIIKHLSSAGSFRTLYRFSDSRSTYSYSTGCNRFRLYLALLPKSQL